MLHVLLAKLLCVGDFNINLLNTISQSYVSTIESNGFTILNKVDSENATHGNGQSGTIIDHAFTDLYCQKFFMCLDDVSFTDHKSLLISFDYNRLCNLNTERQTLKYDFDRISTELVQTLETTVSLNSFTELITDTMARNSFPVHTSNRYRSKAPWIDEEVLREIRSRNQLYKRTIQWPANHIIQHNYKRQKNYVTRIIKQKQKSYYQNLIAQNRNNIRKVWSILNEIVFHKNTKGIHKGITEIIVDDRILKDKTEICNAFNNYFINIPCELSNNLLRMFNHDTQNFTLHTAIQSSIVMLPASTNEISNYVRGLRKSSAVGIDGIPSMLIKNNIPLIFPKLTYLINQSLEEGVFPNCLKSAKVVPIYKSGQKNNTSNYRPISILPTLSKPFEKLIEQRLCSFFNRHNIINKNQYGFQPNSNTTSATVNLVNEIQQNIDLRKICSTIFIDVSKAFDCVPHCTLLSKLQSYGIRHNALQLLETYLNG